MTLALGLTFSACTGPSGQASDPTPPESQTPTAAADSQTAESESPAPAEDVELPDFIETYPDAEVISSSRGPVGSGELEPVSLVMRVAADPKDIAAFYTERFEKAGFDTFGKESQTKAAQVVNFQHKDNDGMLVITISEDPDDESASIVTIGGNIAP